MIGLILFVVDENKTQSVIFFSIANILKEQMSAKITFCCHVQPLLVLDEPSLSIVQKISEQTKKQMTNKTKAIHTKSFLTHNKFVKHTNCEQHRHHSL